MLISAAQVLRERGAAGVTIDSVLARSGAPRGSVYHHFPEGRRQLLAEALGYAGDYITAVIDKAAAKGARVVLRDFVGFWDQLLTEGDFAAGCPVAAAALGSTEDEVELSAAAGVILSRWCAALTRAFVADGFDEPDAESLAVTSVAALEGAIMLCRSTGSAAPLRQVGDQVEFLVTAREFVHRQAAAGNTRKA
ncbi:TetR/AcrR family transcriptional regulator [Mycobacterium simiae]|uniref:TetR/AcrR family transcriptional regulator n=2 Tax=Mycobacterium simiae TaxID=1784 RepID=A0A5B1BJV9_MYCSI|nr:TetR/AcrR family transcriptional regulator [Mycobacterium simiae]